MFIIVPLIIIFFCIAYLKINIDVGIISYTVVFGIILFTIVISYKIYKSFKEDLEVQDQNATKIQINEILQKINISENEELKKSLQEKVNRLKKELK